MIKLFGRAATNVRPQPVVRDRTVEEELAAWRAYQRRSAAQPDGLKEERARNDALWARSPR